MDIDKYTYKKLSAKHRAIAAFAAVIREDQGEIERLISNAPRGKNHGQTIIALSQAINAYNSLTGRAMRDYFLISGRLYAALSFCSAWLEAGGAIDASEYKENALIIEKLSPQSKEAASIVRVIQQVALEWCAKHDIPTDFFSGILCHIPLPKEISDQDDNKMLEFIRSIFDQITLTW